MAALIGADQFCHMNRRGTRCETAWVVSFWSSLKPEPGDNISGSVSRRAVELIVFDCFETPFNPTRCHSLGAVFLLRPTKASHRTTTAKRPA